MIPGVPVYGGYFPGLHLGYGGNANQAGPAFCSCRWIRLSSWGAALRVGPAAMVG
jgi:hypothetical protein